MVKSEAVEVGTIGKADLVRLAQQKTETKLGIHYKKKKKVAETFPKPPRGFLKQISNLQSLRGRF